MRFIRALGAIATITVVAAACADQPDTEVDDLDIPPASETSVPPATPAADDMPAQTLTMNSVGGSQVTGDIEIDDDAGQLAVNVHLRNSTDGAVHQGHIHTGTCDALGSVVEPLAEVTVGSDGEGTSENTVMIPMATVLDGQHVVAFHEAGGNPGASIVCAAIPAQGAAM
ncbi:MAG: hypothetical protein ACREKM_09085 [Longimicrobiales bacterium]